jgi:hypothetical protein
MTPCSLAEFAIVSDELTATIFCPEGSTLRLQMETASLSEILVNIYQTTRYYIPAGSSLHVHLCERIEHHVIYSSSYYIVFY